MLQITNSRAEIDGKPILKRLSLAANAGEAQAIVNPKGAGFSSVQANRSG